MFLVRLFYFFLILLLLSFIVVLGPESANDLLAVATSVSMLGIIVTSWLNILRSRRDRKTNKLEIQKLELEVEKLKKELGQNEVTQSDQ